MNRQIEQSIGEQTIGVEDVQIEVLQTERDARQGMVVAAAHPASGFGVETVRLLADSARAAVVCINPPGLGRSKHGVSLEQMVDCLETVRRRLGLARWVFWGMSGGGWLAQLYAHLHPGALAGIIVESACRCFRERLADPACALSPFFPAWRDALRSRGLLVEGLHTSRSSAQDAQDAEWMEVDGVGQVFRRRGGGALLVSPMPIGEEMKRAMPALWTFDSRAWLDALRTPTLVIAGAADPVVPEHRVREVHEAVRGSAYVVVEGGGHVPSAERRAQAIDAVRSFVAERALVTGR
jgi:pimeloyl-ACP methyl ester carboxylesterase